MQESLKKRPFGYFPDSSPICAKCRRDIPLDQINVFAPCGCSQYHPQCVEELETAEDHDYHFVRLMQSPALRCHGCRKQVDNIVFGYRNGQFLQSRRPSVGLQSPVTPYPNHHPTFISPIQLPNNNYHDFPGSFRNPMSGIPSNHHMPYSEHPIPDWQESNDRQSTNNIYPGSAVGMSNSMPSIGVPHPGANDVNSIQYSNLDHHIQQQDPISFENHNTTHPDVREQNMMNGRPMNYVHTTRHSSFDHIPFPNVKISDDPDNMKVDSQIPSKSKHETQGQGQKQLKGKERRSPQPRNPLTKDNPGPDIHIHYRRRWIRRPRITRRRDIGKTDSSVFEREKQSERNQRVHIYVEDARCSCFRLPHQNRRERRRPWFDDNCCIC